jgi:ferredoxin
MSVRKATELALQAWVDGLIGRTSVVGVQARDDKFEFAPLKRAADLRLDYDVTLTPPGRVVLQPAAEVMLRFDGAEFESVLQDGPFVLFGVHPYDMAAINQMDAVFTQDNYDAHYMARREAATIVAVDVQNVSKNCFAAQAGYAAVEEGFDALLTLIGDGRYLIDARTEKGEALLEGLAQAEDASEEDLAAREAVWQENRERLSRHEFRFEVADLPAILDRSFDHPVWKERSRLCFACGSCTNVCPTCYCFDVQDEPGWDLESGERRRTWDGCQLAKFARVAGGHNFRSDLLERYRHRYYRKGKWIAQKVGQLACVGCGRCITVCVSKIAHPPEVWNRLLEDE